MKKIKMEKAEIEFLKVLGQSFIRLKRFIKKNAPDTDKKGGDEFSGLLDFDSAR